VNIDELEAGADLDELVAERVMGWKLVPNTAYVVTVEAAIKAGKYEWDDAEGNYIADGLGYDHEFSTDLAAAWQVVERMGKLGKWCQMRTPWGKGKDDDGYWAGFTSHLTTGWNGKPDHWTQADTLPLAICRASLKATEAKA
jgi:hypothetical protein